jgi:hypothetical protein
MGGRAEGGGERGNRRKVVGKEKNQKEEEGGGRRWLKEEVPRKSEFLVFTRAIIFGHRQSHFYLRRRKNKFKIFHICQFFRFFRGIT